MSSSVFRDYVDWLWQAKGAPYVWWLGGEVSRGDGPPAWSVNEPLPDIEDVKAGGFCVAVYNLACRWYGLTIPNPYGDEAWDGGVVATWEYWYSSSMWYRERKAEGFQDGDLLIAPYGDVSSQGHVAMICHYQGMPYVLEWITSSGLTWNYTPDQSFEWGQYQIVVPMELWARGKADPSPGKKPNREALIKAIDPYLSNQGEVIYDAADKTGLELALACALVEQESGGANIFGCDGGDVGDTPPYCHQPVTKERVRALIASPYMNGVGLTQLTWWTFVEDAEALGGAHIPSNQCEVGFKLLKDYIDTYPYLEALGAYNAGEGNRWLGIDNGYAGAVAEKHASWKSYLATIPDDPGPDPGPEPGPDPDIGIDVDTKVKEQIKKWGLYYFASDSDKDWNLTYVPAGGKTGPTADAEKHKARTKPQEVTFYKQDGKYVVVQPNGTEITYSEDEFKQKYEEVE